MIASLPNAMRAFVEAKCDRAEMHVPSWATTFKCEGDDIRKAFEVAITEYSRKPQNTGQEHEGK